MSKWKDFEFCAAGWDKKRWDLRYTGENKDLVIPEKMIAKAGEKATIAISAANGNELESITLPKTFMMFGLVRFMVQKVWKKLLLIRKTHI